MRCRKICAAPRRATAYDGCDAARQRQHEALFLLYSRRPHDVAALSLAGRRRSLRFRMATVNWRSHHGFRIIEAPKQQRTQEEFEKIVFEQMPQVKYIARRIHEHLPQHVPFEDLVHAGIVGLIDALNKFDSEKNVKFASYAKFRIRGAILDSLREIGLEPTRFAQEVAANRNRGAETAGGAGPHRLRAGTGESDGPVTARVAPPAQ